MPLTIIELNSDGDWATWFNQDYSILDPIIGYAQTILT